MKITVIKKADRTRPGPTCPWLIDYPYDKVEQPQR
jgi:hypothetical protein